MSCSPPCGLVQDTYCFIPRQSPIYCTNLSFIFPFNFLSIYLLFLTSLSLCAQFISEEGKIPMSFDEVDRLWELMVDKAPCADDRCVLIIYSPPLSPFSAC